MAKSWTKVFLFSQWIIFEKHIEITSRVYSLIACFGYLQQNNSERMS